MESSKQRFERNLIRSSNSQPKRLFSYLRHLHSNNSIPHTIFDRSTQISSRTAQVEAFNIYFNSVFTRSDFILPPVDRLPTPSIQLNSIQITSSDISAVISQLDPHKAYGCDYISPYIIKSCIGPLLEHITNLFTYCIQYCTIPDEWKIHKICPIPKGGSRSDITNYRPISLLCILSKILESVIYRKIITFIHPRISLQQFGFLSKRSCLSQLLLSYSNIFKSIENGQYSDVIYLDFKKAFDTVPHSELLFKLWQIGITGPLWSWFQNYLSNRLHYVEIDNVTSTLLPVISGIPQGSILGPLLFIIYINDLPEAITSSSTYLFADDTKLIHSVSTFYDQSLQSDLDSLSAWCHQWKLSLNPSKCSYI